MEAFLTSTLLVAAAEIGDKTQLLSFVLAARLRKPLAIIAGIEEADSRKAMRAYLTVVVKYFDPNSNARKEMPAHLAKYKKLTGKGEIAPDWYAYEFSQRRFKEGGNDLLKMYVQIIKDLAESLE